MAYVYLAFAVLLEVSGTLLLPRSDNFTKPAPTLALALCYLASFYLLTHALKSLPLAVVYASWSGLGIFTIAILGYFLYGQALSWLAVLGMVLIVVGVVLVNSVTSLH